MGDFARDAVGRSPSSKWVYYHVCQAADDGRLVFAAGCSSPVRVRSEFPALVAAGKRLPAQVYHAFAMLAPAAFDRARSNRLLRRTGTSQEEDCLTFSPRKPSRIAERRTFNYLARLLVMAGQSRPHMQIRTVPN